MQEKTVNSGFGTIDQDEAGAKNPLSRSFAGNRPTEAQNQALSALQAWNAMAQGAYPENTKRAWRADWAIFKAFCEAQGFSALPALPTTVREFIRACVELKKKPATIRRYVATIARAHRAADLESPCTKEPVRLALKEMTRTMAVRQRQARALGWAEIKAFNDSAGKGIRADRERALLCVAYDTMARRAELVALDLMDVTFGPDGSGTALIRRSKTDQAGEGARAYLSRDTARFLQIWIKGAKIENGALFRRIIGGKTIGARLHPNIVASIYKRVGRRLNLGSEDVAAISGHSVRVGATQDLLALNIDLASVMQAGRWKSTFMPMRYGEHVLAARGGMARAAAKQGRD